MNEKWKKLGSIRWVFIVILIIWVIGRIRESAFLERIASRTSSTETSCPEPIWGRHMLKVTAGQTADGWSEPIIADPNMNVAAHFEIRPVTPDMYWAFKVNGDERYIYHKPPVNTPGKHDTPIQVPIHSVQVRLEDEDGNPLIEECTASFVYTLTPERS